MIKLSVSFQNTFKLMQLINARYTESKEGTMMTEGHQEKFVGVLLSALQQN